jgi:glycosyltransferase involved in cell wall biosynthesis
MDTNKSVAGNSGVDRATTLRHLEGQRVAVLLFAHYPSDPRPRRAAETLAEQGMKVEVISLKQDDREPVRDEFNGVKIFRVPLKKWRGGKFAYIFQYGAFIVASFLLLAFRSLTGRYRLVHVHNMPDILVFSSLIPRLLGAKVMLDLHDPMPELMQTIFGFKEESRAVGILKFFEKLSIGFADAIVVVNQACKTIFSSRSCREEKISVVMNSPDEGIFKYRETPDAVKSARESSKPFVIMYHGSIVERHGLDLAVSALGQLKRSVPRAELRIYGQSTAFLEQVLASVKGTPLAEAVRYYGPKKLEQIVEAIRQCDLGIIPNRKSIFTQINTPTRIFEYLSQGKPVIAPRVTGIQDYFSAEEILYFELGDAIDLAEKMQYAFFHPEELEKITRRGQEVYQDHKWSCERQRLVNLVAGLLGAKIRRTEPVVDYPGVLEPANDRRGSPVV